jgi:hypothetical protein
MLAGLEKPEEGSIEVKGEVWYDSKRGINLLPQKRDVGFVFQDYALFPNMSLFENIAFGMKKKDPQRVMELLKLAGLEQLKDKKPSVLSGGQKQRVALLRALYACILSVAVGSEVVQVVVPRDQEEEFKPGDRVLLSTKAFVPIVRKAEVVFKIPRRNIPPTFKGANPRTGKRRATLRTCQATKWVFIFRTTSNNCEGVLKIMP